MEYCNILYCYNGILQYIVLLQWNIAIYCIVTMEYCNIFIAEYQYNQYNNNIIVPSAALCKAIANVTFNIIFAMRKHE